MESSNGYNTNALIDPIDFYNVIINNIDKFSNNDRFIILRFFDKLTDFHHCVNQGLDIIYLEKI